MSGPRLVSPHFDRHEADLLRDMASGEEPWVHEDSEARRKEEAAVPSDEIDPRDYIMLRRDKPAREIS